MSVTAFYEAPGARRLRLSNEVAKRHGLKCVNPYEGKRGARDSDGEVTCDECSFVVPEGREVWCRKVSYEYDEWESYCSHACASRLGHSGIASDFLERMDWMLKPKLDSDGWVWAYVPDTESFRTEGLEGDERWQVDSARAAQLAAEVEAMLCNG